jgi:cytochrome c oxidase subunit 3
MAARVIANEVADRERVADGAPPDVLGLVPEGGDGPGDGRVDPVRFGLWAFLGTVCMLFIGFTSAYILRRSSADWRDLAAPPLLWLNTAALLTSSVTLEMARRRLRGWDLPATQRWVQATGLLGLLFLAGQLGAWRVLASEGVYLATNPHSSFFYVLTGLHGVHLLGGLVWFAVVLARVRRMAYTPGSDGLGLFATYWHFLAALWLYLLFLLFAF